jgi:predicted kinase
MADIHLVFGRQGAGKTTYSRQLADQADAVRFSIDDWMGELYAPDLPQPLNLGWVMERVQRCESRIWATASQAVQRGTSVVLDLGFIKAGDRARFVSRARESGNPVLRHFVTAPLELRRQRVASRNLDKGETYAFEVTPGMFDFMERQFEAPANDELVDCVVFESR